MFIIYQKNDKTKWHDSVNNLHDKDTQGVFKFALNENHKANPQKFAVNEAGNNLYLHLPSIIEDAVNQITQKHHDRKNELLDNPTALTINSWEMKFRSAKDLKIGKANQSEITLLEEETKKTGETVNELITKILSNHQRYLIITGTLDGLKRKAIKDIEASTTNSKIKSLLANTLKDMEEYTPI